MNMGNERIRIADIAEELGLSTATVSNVIHGKTQKLSDETVKRVQALIEKRGYFPGMADILLAQNNAKIIGIVINDHEKYEGHVLEDGFISASLNALSQEINSAGYFMMLKTTTARDEIVRFASMWNMVGLIIIGFCEQDYQKLREFMHIPFVVYDGFFQKTQPMHRLCNLSIDHYSGGYQAGNYLKRMGHRHVLCIADNLTCMDAERIAGCTAAMGKDAVHFLQVPSQARERKQFYQDKAAELIRYSAIFSVSDFYALELMNDLQRKGIRIPEDIGKPKPMNTEKIFRKAVRKIALPITMQTLLQSSFSIIDQIMIGQLGSSSIAGIGLGGKFISLYTVILGAITSAAGIMIAQFMGKKDEGAVAKSFYTNLLLTIGLSVFFIILCVGFSDIIMSFYTRDSSTKALAANYLHILSLSFLPMAIHSMLTVLFCCMEKTTLPLYTSLIALICNTGLNYLLIFGKWIFPPMGVKGAAIASTSAQILSGILLLFFFVLDRQARKITPFPDNLKTLLSQSSKGQYWHILCPLLICELLWSLGENVYTAIYGNIGTEACAAMTMTIPVQTMVIGALSGLSQAASVLIGKSLGAQNYTQAYWESKQLMIYGAIFSITLSLLLILICPLYVMLYPAAPNLQETTKHLLIALAFLSPVKVLNMILGGGIMRSGGKTKDIMWIDIIGTWGFGVPLGLLSAFVWKLSVVYVYFLLSLEECVRLGISIRLFRKRSWIKTING